MASLLSSTQIAAATGAISSDFDTYSRNIVVFKAPIKTLVSNTNSYAGYDESNEEYTYTYVSGVYPAKIRHNLQSVKEVNSVPVAFSDGKIKIKVKQDCRDFINDGKTENILVDGNLFNIASDDGVRNYLGWQVYEFTLERTK